MASSMQPVLSDARVIIRPMAADDYGALFAVASDPLIWEVHPAHDRWQEPVFRQFFADGLASNGALTIIDRATGLVIGSSRNDTSRDSCRPGEVEIGWTYIARSYWGGNWNRSIKRLMLSHVFDAGFEAAIFLVGETNIRSRRAMEKIGGRLTDRVQIATMAGAPVTHVLYAITPDEFARGPLSLG